MIYESKNQALINHKAFLTRLIQHGALIVLLLSASLVLGMIGYVYFESLSWMDAFLNSAMLLGGMGPVNAPVTNMGKLFAGLYALYAGLIFIISAALIFTPVVHRVLHHFHLDKSN